MKILKLNESNLDFQKFEEINKLEKEQQNILNKINILKDEIKPDLFDFLCKNADYFDFEANQCTSVKDFKILGPGDFEFDRPKNKNYLLVYLGLIDYDEYYEDDLLDIYMTKKDMNNFLIYLNSKKFNV